jgi:hypothetical protein
MATPTQYAFELKEVATALIKAQNIHTGKWWVLFDFTLGAGMFGGVPGAPSSGDQLPGAFFQIRRIMLAQAGEPPPPAALVVDAAEVNPNDAPAAIKAAPAGPPP